MRVQVNLSDELVSKVDFWAKKIGVSRSALCSVLVGNGIMGYDKALEVFEQMKTDFTNDFTENK